MKANHLIAASLSLLAFFVGVEPALAKACKDVTFNVTNDHFERRSIKIQKVRYRNPNKDGKVQTEDVRDLICEWGQTCSTGGDNLSGAAKVDLWGITVVFRHLENDGDWSGQFETQPFTPKYRKCTDGKKYGPIVVRDSL